MWLFYIASNMVGISFLWISAKRTRLARLLFSVLFGSACIANLAMSHNEPQVYLHFAETSISPYTEFIRGWFSRHITEVVTCIAIGQAFISIGMLLRGWVPKLACAGAILFLLAIAPLGLNAAFPFSITTSLAAYFILRKDDKNYIWIVNKGIL